MQIWMVNTRGALAQDHGLLIVLWQNLRARRGRRIDQFASLRTLARLPWLDQPQFVEPTHLTLELYAAWDELWTLELSELAVRPAPADGACYSWRAGNSHTFGSYFATPMHQLAAFAASTTKRRRIRVATHRGLALGSTPISELRVIQGGQSGAREQHSI